MHPNFADIRKERNLPAKNAREDWQDHIWNIKTVRINNIQIIPPVRINRMKPLLHEILIVYSGDNFPPYDPPSSGSDFTIFLTD